MLLFRRNDGHDTRERPVRPCERCGVVFVARNRNGSARPPRVCGPCGRVRKYGG